MGGGMRQVSEILPLTFAVRAIQRPWLGIGASATDFLLLAGMLVVAAGISARVTGRTTSRLERVSDRLHHVRLTHRPGRPRDRAGKRASSASRGAA
jgi:HAMP domain-containing protein